MNSIIYFFRISLEKAFFMYSANRISLYFLFLPSFHNNKYIRKIQKEHKEQHKRETRLKLYLKEAQSLSSSFFFVGTFIDAQQSFCVI